MNMTMWNTIIYITVTVCISVYISQFINRVGGFVDTVINSCENGAQVVDNACDCSDLPFSGRNCQTSSCKNGFEIYDVQTVRTIKRTNTLWSCYCNNRYSGYECDICNAEGEDCDGNCKPAYYGALCQNVCYADLTETTKFLSIGNGVECADAVNNGGTCTYCHENGRCSDGKCQCDTGFSGPTCNVECPKHDGVYCGGNGMCFEGKCECENGFSGTACEFTCPNQCSGKGLCSVSENEAVCVCNDKYRGDHCQYLCPGLSVCSGRGTCGSLGECTCVDGWEGSACNCNAATTCNGRGTCMSDGSCICDHNRIGNCQSCIPMFYGDGCDIECNANEHCNGHGACSVSGTCKCDSGWDGTDCSECAPDTYPLAKYTNPCLFRITNATCNNNGHANQNYGNSRFDAFNSAGIYTGKYMCTCTGKFSPESFCTECMPDYYLPDCSKHCDANMCNNGACVEDGTCSCFAGFFGEFCDSSCNTVNGVVCSGHGRCQGDRWVNGVTTKCVCDEGYEGDTCQLSAPSADGNICNGRGVAMVSGIVHTGLPFECESDSDCGNPSGVFTSNTKQSLAMQQALRQALFQVVGPDKPYGPMCKRNMVPSSVRDVAGAVGTINIPEWSMSSIGNGPFRKEVPDGFIYPLYTVQKYDNLVVIDGIRFYGPNVDPRDYACHHMSVEAEVVEAGCVWMGEGLCNHLMLDVDASEWCYKREQYETNKCDKTFICDVAFACTETCNYIHADTAIYAWNAKHMQTPFDGEDLIRSTFNVTSEMYLTGATVDDCDTVINWDIPVRSYPSPRWWCQFGDIISETDDPKYEDLGECNEIDSTVADFGGFVVSGVKYNTFREAMVEVDDNDIIVLGNNHQYAETMTVDEMCEQYYDHNCTETWRSDGFVNTDFDGNAYNMFQYTFKLNNFNPGTHILLKNSTGIMLAITHDQKLSLRNDVVIDGPPLSLGVSYTVRFVINGSVLTCLGEACPTRSIDVRGQIDGLHGDEVGASMTALHAFNDENCKETSWRLRVPPGWNTTKTIWGLCNERYGMRIRSKALCEYRDTFKLVQPSTLTRAETLRCVRFLENPCPESECTRWVDEGSPLPCTTDINPRTPTVEQCATEDWVNWCTALQNQELEGRCAIVQCDCNSDTFLGVAGAACQLSCPVNSETGTACGFQNPPDYSFGTCKDIEAILGQHVTESTCVCQRSNQKNCDEQCDDATEAKCNTGEYRRVNIRSFDAWGYEDFISDRAMNMMPYDECVKYLDHHKATQVDNVGSSGTCHWTENNVIWGGGDGNLISSLITSKEECDKQNTGIGLYVAETSGTPGTPVAGGIVYNDDLVQKKIYHVLHTGTCANRIQTAAQCEAAARVLWSVDAVATVMSSAGHVQGCFNSIFGLKFNTASSSYVCDTGTNGWEHSRGCLCNVPDIRVFDIEFETGTDTSVIDLVPGTSVSIGTNIVEVYSSTQVLTGANIEAETQLVYGGTETTLTDPVSHELWITRTDTIVPFDSEILNYYSTFTSGVAHDVCTDLIKDKEECEAAAFRLGLTDTTATDVSSPLKPPGCFFNEVLYFNAHINPNLSPCSNSEFCICIFNTCHSVYEISNGYLYTLGPTNGKVDRLIDVETSVDGYIYTVGTEYSGYSGFVNGLDEITTYGNRIYLPSLVEHDMSLSIWSGTMLNLWHVLVETATQITETLVVGDQLRGSQIHDVKQQNIVTGTLTGQVQLYSNVGMYEVSKTEQYGQKMCDVTCITCSANVGDILTQGVVEALVYKKSGSVYQVLTKEWTSEGGVYTHIECTNLTQVTLVKPMVANGDVTMGSYPVLTHQDTTVIVITNDVLEDYRYSFYVHKGVFDYTVVENFNLITADVCLDIGDIPFDEIELLSINIGDTIHQPGVSGTVVGTDPLRLTSTNGFTNEKAVRGVIREVSIVSSVPVTKATIYPTLLRFSSGSLGNREILGEVDGTITEIKVVGTIQSGPNMLSVGVPDSIKLNKKIYEYGDTLISNVGDVVRQGTSIGVVSYSDKIYGDSHGDSHVTMIESTDILTSGTTTFGAPQTFSVRVKASNAIFGSGGMCTVVNGVHVWDSIGTTAKKVDLLGGTCTSNPAYVPLVNHPASPTGSVTGEGCYYYNNTHVVQGRNIGNPVSALVTTEQECSLYVEFHVATQLTKMGGHVCSYNSSHVVWGPTSIGMIVGMPSGELPLKISRCMGGMCECNSPNYAPWYRYATSFTGTRTRILEARYFGRHKRTNFMQGPQPYLINHVKYKNVPITLDNWETMYDLWVESKSGFTCSNPQYANSGQSCGPNIMCTEQSEVCQYVSGIGDICVKGAENDIYIGIYTYNQCLSDNLLLSSLQGSSSYRGKYCMDECPHITEYGTPCAGHGRCARSGQCSCDVASTMVKYTQNTRTVIDNSDGQPLISIMGQETMTMEERTGWRGDACGLKCRGYNEETTDMTGICSKNGQCNSDVSCTCAIGFTGDNCQLDCPSTTELKNIVCNGHGACQPAVFKTTFSTGIQNEVTKWNNECTEEPSLLTKTLTNVVDTLKTEQCDYPVTGVDQCTMKMEPFTQTSVEVVSRIDAPSGCILEGSTALFNTKQNEIKCHPGQQCMCQMLTVSELQFFEDVISTSNIYMDADGKLVETDIITPQYVKQNSLRYPFNIVLIGIGNIKLDHDNSDHLRGGEDCVSTMISNSDLVRPQIQITRFMDQGAEDWYTRYVSSTVNIPDPIFPYEVDTVENCKVKCLDDPECNGFEHDGTLCKFVSSWTQVVPALQATFYEINRCEPIQTISQTCDILNQDEVLCAECACSTTNGVWGGLDCRTCQLGFGGNSCKQKCPGYDGVSPESICGGIGACEFGSVNAEGDEFKTPSCVCGDNPNDRVGLQQCELYTRGTNTKKYNRQSSQCTFPSNHDRCVQYGHALDMSVTTVTTGPSGCYFVDGHSDLKFNDQTSDTVCGSMISAVNSACTAELHIEACKRAAFELGHGFQETSSAQIPKGCSLQNNADVVKYNNFNANANMVGFHKICGGYQCICDTPNYLQSGGQDTCQCKRGYSGMLCNQPTPTCLFGGAPTNNNNCKCEIDSLDPDEHCCPEGTEGTGMLKSGVPTYITDTQIYTSTYLTTKRTKEMTDLCIPKGSLPMSHHINRGKRFIEGTNSFSEECIDEPFYDPDACLRKCNDNDDCNGIYVYEETHALAGKCCYYNTWTSVGGGKTHSCSGWDCEVLGDVCFAGYTCCSAANNGCTDGTCWHASSDLSNAGECAGAVSAYVVRTKMTNSDVWDNLYLVSSSQPSSDQIKYEPCTGNGEFKNGQCICNSGWENKYCNCNEKTQTQSGLSQSLFVSQDANVADPHDHCPAPLRKIKTIEDCTAAAEALGLRLNIGGASETSDTYWRAGCFWDEDELLSFNMNVDYSAGSHSFPGLPVRQDWELDLGTSLYLCYNDLMMKTFECAPGTCGDNHQCVCPVGTSGTSVCVSCVPGLYQDQTNQVACKSCYPGSITNELLGTGSTSCTQCAVGQKSTTSTVACTVCTLGLYQDKNGQTSCKSCPGGQYQDQNVQTSCKSCETGKYTNQNHQGSCKYCPSGQYQNYGGQTSCTSCGAGQYQSQNGKTSCSDCPKGKYQAQGGKSSCHCCAVDKCQPSNGGTSCPRFATTEHRKGCHTCAQAWFFGADITACGGWHSGC